MGYVPNINPCGEKSSMFFLISKFSPNLSWSIVGNNKVTSLTTYVIQLIDRLKLFTLNHVTTSEAKAVYLEKRQLLAQQGKTTQI